MHLKLVERSEQQLRFRNGRGQGWVFLAIGLVFLSAGLTQSGLEAVFLLLFSLPCLGAGAWVASARYELTLDLLARRWEGCRGHWPSPATCRGSFDQIECVVLRKQRRGNRKRGGSYDHDHVDWLVLLQLTGWPPLSVFWSRSEAAAVEQFEHYARVLDVPAVDRSGRSRAVEDKDILERLDKVTSEQPTASGRPSPPPAGAAVAWHDGGTAATIELKRGGYTGGAWFPLVFGAAFFTAGVGFLATATWGFGILFSLAGLGILALLTVGLCSRHIVREEEREIVVELNMLGWAMHVERWPKNEVERVVCIKVPGRVPVHGPTTAENENLGPQAAEVILRRGDEVIRLARGADDETQQWLCRTLQQLVAR